ncbi:hypothetical protein SAMN05421748_120180 [Paractinoplanes atraurantiacus]|uniref:Uncharacterized protein n=1 Tax=Paractinoplanes atraurantiacus TaxID=1036182 RepID=A0A285JJU8_9ACTN|nr:hypothetical protein SAMN05421748_120180 [Actinoplanes atraurantiacus]
MPASALREFFALAAGRDLHPQRPDGLINLFPGPRTVQDLDVAIRALAAGDEGQCFRHHPDLHGRLTGLWLEAAQRLNAESGRVLDEWSVDQIWHLGVHDAVHAAGGWPAELGWCTYLGPDDSRPAPPLPEVAARTRRLPNGALLVRLLDDPAAVDVLRYESLHRRWLASSGNAGEHDLIPMNPADHGEI